MSLILSELGPFEKNALLDYLASDAVGFEDLHAVVASPRAGDDYAAADDDAMTIAVDVDFPEEFFDVLGEMAQAKEQEESLRLEEGTGRGLRTLGWVRSMIRKFYDYRWSQFHLELVGSDHHVHAEPTVNDMSTHLFQFISKEVGVGELVRRYAMDVLDGVRAYRGADLDVQLFGVLIHSGVYDTIDSRALLSWAAGLDQYSIPVKGIGGVSHPHVRLRDVPYLLRQLLLSPHSSGLRPGGGGDRPLLPTRSRGAWERCRSAFVQWCDESGRVPQVVADPKFYIPPFSPSHPYVGRERGGAADEARFARFGQHVLVPVAQLLTLMLLNFKVERTEAFGLSAAGGRGARSHQARQSRSSSASNAAGTRPRQMSTGAGGAADALLPAPAVGSTGASRGRANTLMVADSLFEEQMRKISSRFDGAIRNFTEDSR